MLPWTQTSCQVYHFSSWYDFASETLNINLLIHLGHSDVMIDLNNPIPTHRLFNHLSWQQLSHTVSTYSQWRRGLHQLPDWCVQWTHLFNRLSLLNTEILPTFSGDDANDGSHDLSQTTPQRFERSHMIIWQNPSPSMPSCALWTLRGWGNDGAERYTKSWDGIGVFYEPKEKFTSIIAWICSD